MTKIDDLGAAPAQALDIRTAAATLPPRVLIYGQEGVGKTSLAAKFPSPIFLLVEDGIPAGIKVASLGGLLENYAERPIWSGRAGKRAAQIPDRRDRCARPA